jgi:hypothetical protein
VSSEIAASVADTGNAVPLVTNVVLVGLLLGAWAYLLFCMRRDTPYFHTFLRATIALTAAAALYAGALFAGLASKAIVFEIGLGLALEFAFIVLIFRQWAADSSHS